MATRAPRSQRQIIGSIGGHTSWANTENPTARTAPARRAFMERFEVEVDPDGRLDPAERQRRAESARRAYFARLSLKGVQARQRKGGARATA